MGKVIEILVRYEFNEDETAFTGEINHEVSDGSELTEDEVLYYLAYPLSADKRKKQEEWDKKWQQEGERWNSLTIWGKIKEGFKDMFKKAV